MKLQVDEDGDILLTEVYSGVGFKSSDGETLGICMRDTGFEFNYMGAWYEAKGGEVRKLKTSWSEKDDDNNNCCDG